MSTKSGIFNVEIIGYLSGPFFSKINAVVAKSKKIYQCIIHPGKVE